MFKNKLLRIAVLTLALVMLLSASAFAEETESSEDTTLTFGIFSDVHSSSASTPLANVMNNIETLAGGNENVDGILMVGDIAYLNDVQQPQASTYNFIRDNADLAYFKSAGKLVYAMGNHEFTQGTKDPDSIALAKEVFTEQVGVSPESHTVLGGYHFITAGPYDYDVGGLSAEQEQYVIDEVTEALKDGENKPVFVLIHHPIDGVLYGSGSKRHSDEFVEFLKSEPRLFIFNAHTHYPTSDPRSIRQIEGGATFLYTSCVGSGGNGVTNPYADGRHDNTKAAPQGYMMFIDTETNVVTLKRFHVDSTPEYIDAEDWVFDVPAMVAESEKDTVDLDVYKYTYEEREANSVAPVYKAEDAINVTELTTKLITFNFPVATAAADGEDNMVGYYKIELYNKATGKTETIKFISDYFMKAPTQRTSYSRTFSSLSYDTEYKLTVTPLNMWYKEGEPLVLEFKSEGLPSNLGKILGYDETYYAAPVSINASGDGMEIDTSAAFKLTEDNNKRLAGLYAVSKDTGFATRTVLYVYGSKEAREDLYEMPNGKYSLLSGGGSGKFSPGNFSSNVWIGAAGASTFFSDSQWSRANMVNYVFATDDPEGTEGGKTAAEKKLEAMNKMITAVKNENAYVTYTFSGKGVTPISEADTFKFGFFLHSNLGSMNLTINNNAYRFVAYVMDLDGKVTTHSTVKDGLTLKTGSSTNVATYATVNFKTDEWDIALPEEGYLVACRIYPYHGVNDPADITLTCSKSTAGAVGSGDNVRFVAAPSTYTVDVPKAEKPRGITVEGKTFKGLDKLNTYYVAPYSINGIDNTKAIEITGVTSYTLPEGSVGLYGIYFKGNDIDLISSDAFVTYVRGPYAPRADIIEVWKAGDKTVDGSIISAGNSWIGKLKHASYKNAFYPGFVAHNTTTYTGYGDIGIIADGHFTTSYAQNLWDGRAANDTTKIATAFKNLWDEGHKYVVKYALTDEEIIPITEVNKYTFGLKREQGFLIFNNNTVRFDAYVMNKDGETEIYTRYFKNTILGEKNNPTKEILYEVDFTTATGWEKALPTDDDCYFVGFAVYPFWDIGKESDLVFDPVARPTHNTRAQFRHVKSGYSIDIPQDSAPNNIELDGNTIKNLDETKTYVIAPYDITGKGTGIEIKNATTYTFPADAVGIYGISVKGDGEYFGNSDPVIIFARGTYKARQDIHDRATTGEWVGYYKIGSTPKLGSFSYSGSWGHHSSFTVNGICTQSDHISSDIFKTFYNAYTAEGADDDDKKAAYATMLASSNIENAHLKYNMAADEIIPISEVVKYSYSVKKERGGFDYNNQVSEFIAIIMDENGNLKEYTYQHAKANFSPTAVTKTVDFKNNESASGKWIDALPTEGYLVGFRLMVYANISDINNAVITKYDYGTRALVNPATEYVIDVTKSAAPEGITTEGTTFKNLDPEKTYFVAPYTVVGVTEADKKKVTGVASVDISALYENLVGLYGIYYAADDYYTDSDLGAVIYVAGSVEARKSLGNLVTRTYTWNNGANSVEYECADFLKHTESKTEWALGKLAGAEYFIYLGKDYNSYKSDWMYDVPSSKALYEAKQKNDGSYEQLQKQAEATLEGISIRYAYAPEEIIPISDVIEMKFAAGMGTTYVNVANPKYKYVLYVMNTSGTVTQHTLITKTRDITGDVQAAVNEETIRPSDFKDLPSEGWIIGYKFYPYGAVESKNITYRDSQIASSSTQYAVNFKVPVLDFDGYYTIVEDYADFGMSLLLDGKIGIKVTADADETVTGLTVSNVVGTDSYLDFGSNGYAVFYFNPKDVADATVSFDINYTDKEGAETKSYTLTITDYVDALKSSTDEKVVNLTTAFENYFKAAADYFDDEITEVEALAGLSEDELADLGSKVVRDREGAVAGLEFHSTSLILEEDTTIRHYFKITDSSITTNADLEAYTVEGGSALKLANTITDAKNRYAYTDVEGISSNELAVSKTVKITDAENAFLQVDFNALSYVDICLEEEDAKLQNLIKALYRYSVASDAYIAE